MTQSNCTCALSFFHRSLFNSDSIEFINGVDTDKVNTYVEDCIGKMEPLDKVWYQNLFLKVKILNNHFHVNQNDMPYHEKKPEHFN